MKNWVSIFLQTVFSLALLAIWLVVVDLDEVASYLGRVDSKLVALALVFVLCGLIFRTVRWKLVLDSVVNIPIEKLVVYSFMQAFLNYVVPLRAGEFGVSFLIKKRYSLPYSDVLAATLLSRLFDFLAIFFVVFVLSMTLVVFGDVRFLPILAFSFILLTVSLTIFYLVSFREGLALSFAGRLRRLLPNWQIIERFAPSLKQFLQGLQLIKKQNVSLILLSALTLASFIFDGVYLYLIFQAFNISLSYSLVLFSMLLFTLFFLIPSGPLYIGTTEVTGSLIFVFILGLTKNVAASVTVFWHLLNSFLIVSLGLIGFFIYRWKKL